MYARISSGVADILNILQDGKKHTIQELVDETELSRSTVKRYLQSLAYRYPIESFPGGEGKGGVILDKSSIVKEKLLTIEKLQVLGEALELLQNSDGMNESKKNIIGQLIKDFALPSSKENNKNEDQKEQTL